MKKFLGILAIAGTLVACNNAADSEKRIKDSTDSVRRADSINAIQQPAPPVTIDSPLIRVDSPLIRVDSPKVNQ